MRGGQGGCRRGRAVAGAEYLCQARKNASTADGFRTPQGIAFALFHAMGRLPVAEVTHRFCRGGRYLSKRSGKHLMNEPA